MAFCVHHSSLWLCFSARCHHVAAEVIASKYTRILARIIATECLGARRNGVGTMSHERSDKHRQQSVVAIALEKTQAFSLQPRPKCLGVLR
eukprot:2976761-Pleurochrysis_carterae.AAC.1